MSAFPAQCRDARTSHVEHEGTGSLAGHDPDCRAPAHPAPGRGTLAAKRELYVLEDSIENRRLQGATALVSEAEDDTVTIRANGRLLASRLHPKDQAHPRPRRRRRAHASRRRLRVDRRAATRARRRTPRQSQDHPTGQEADPGRRIPSLSPGLGTKTGHLYLGEKRTFPLCVGKRSAASDKGRSSPRRFLYWAVAAGGGAFAPGILARRRLFRFTSSAASLRRLV